MSTDFKALKKLADACRKAGISHYKCQEFEFTLSENGPISNYKKRAAKETPKNPPDHSEIESDSLTSDQLLFWSLADPEDKEESIQ